MNHRIVDPARRESVRAQLQKEYKREVLHAGNHTGGIVRRLDSGSLALNYIMGGGGYPFGIMTRLWGAFSSGKSIAIYKAFHSAQHYGEINHARLLYLAQVAKMEGDIKAAKKLNDEAKRVQGTKLKCMLISTEGELDLSLLESYGVSLKKDDFEIAYSRRIEDIGHIVSQALGAYHVVAVDSTSGTMSIDELATSQGAVKTVEDAANNTGQNRARKWGYCMDWWQDRISPDNVLLFTSQIQQKSGNSYSRQVAEQAPGGEKLNHEPGVVLHFMKGSRLKRRPDGGLEQIGDKGGQVGAFGKTESAGVEVIVECTKNKFGRAERKSLHHFDRTIAQWDWVHEYEKLAKYMRVVDRTSVKSSWYKLPDGSTTQSLRQAVINDPVLRRQIEDRVYRCAADPVYEDEILAGGYEPMLELVESA